MPENHSQPDDHSHPAPANHSRVQEAIDRKIRIDRENAERRKHLDPTRYGDWEHDGRCIDF